MLAGTPGRGALQYYWVELGLPQPVPPTPPFLLFVSKSGRNRLLLAGGRAGSC